MAAASSSGSLTAWLLRPFAQVRNHESATALLMFLYSFLAMTSYNIIQPITRSKFITDLGAENIPYIQFAAGLIIGILMQGYVKATSLVPRRWVIPVSQAAIVVLLVTFWALFQTGQEWVSAAFYLLGLIFAILLVSQFWSLANAIYDARQAKRIFGFIGGGTALGGMMGAGITALIAETRGHRQPDPLERGRARRCASASWFSCSAARRTPWPIRWRATTKGSAERRPAPADHVTPGAAHRRRHHLRRARRRHPGPAAQHGDPGVQGPWRDRRHHGLPRGGALLAVGWRRSSSRCSSRAASTATSGSASR
jgi:hypothetical protein